MSNLAGTAAGTSQVTGSVVIPSGNINATPLSLTANSYATEQEASLYLFSNRYHTSTWGALSFNDRERLLIWATFLLDRIMNWYGARRENEQVLRFPRSGVRDEDGWWFDYDTIPQVLKNATAELAFELAQEDPTDRPELVSLGLSEAKLGPISVKIDETKVNRDLIPGHVFQILRALGYPDDTGYSGDRVMHLGRA